MPKKSFLDDTKLFPELETAEARERLTEAKDPAGEAGEESKIESEPRPPKEEAPDSPKPVREPAKKKVLKTEEKESFRQYAYYDSPERHARIKMWAITSQKADEKDASSIIRKAVDEFLRKRKSE